MDAMTKRIRDIFLTCYFFCCLKTLGSCSRVSALISSFSISASIEPEPMGLGGAFEGLGGALASEEELLPIFPAIQETARYYKRESDVKASLLCKRR